MKRPRHWLWLLLAVPIALGLMRLRFDIEVLDLLPPSLPVVNGLKLYQQNFSNARELIITIAGPEAEATETAARTLAERLREPTNLVSSVTWQPGWLERPAQAAELIGYLWFNQPPRVFAELTDRLTGTNILATLADTREQLATSFSPLELARLSYDPYNLLRVPEGAAGGPVSSFGDGQNLFASRDGRFRILFVQAKPNIGNYRACRRWFDSVKTIITHWRQSGNDAGVRLGCTGAPAFVAEISSGMEFDMTSSIGITSVIIALLFWLAHRRWRPMLWLLALLGLILLGTLGFGGLLFGTINVVSLGFAAILLGLAVDYAVVHYQEAIASPNAIIPEIRRAIGPSIFWAAVTTISAFLVLNLGGLPGLAQLGSLVALGVALSALVMLFAFLPPLFPDRMRRRTDQLAMGMLPAEASTTDPGPLEPGRRRRSNAAFGATALLVLGASATLISGLPRLDHTADALRPQNSPAYGALDEIKARLAQHREPLWILTRGRDESEIARRLERAGALLQRAASNQLIAAFALPTPLWPRPDHQVVNRGAAARLLAKRQQLRDAALAQGFSPASLVMTESILDTWQAATARTNTFWPTNETSRWILEKMVARPGDALLAVGFVYPATNAPVTPQSVARWSNDLVREGFILSGWELLGASVLEQVQRNLGRVLGPMIALVLLSLGLAFRRVKEIALSLLVLLLSGLCLLTVMRLTGWSWNLLNLMALPLMLGSGVDYSIFMQLALRRHRGDLRAAHRAVGRALLLCGGTAVAGFGSLAWSTNAGMASLGKVCAVGIGCNMLISVYLLPFWWSAAGNKPVLVDPRPVG